MNNTSTLLVGGTFGGIPKQSSVIWKLADALRSSTTFIRNGGTIDDLDNTLILARAVNLVLWMANVDNASEKRYPDKSPGAVLICSKVMREGYTKAEAVSRIFKIHGNAVIAIYKTSPSFKFVLWDALGNEWYSGTDIKALAERVLDFYAFTKEAKRICTKQNYDIDIIDEMKAKDENEMTLNKLISINNKLADLVEEKCGSRFFGNISTRCQKLFPSAKIGDWMFVSPRNSDKKRLSYMDMVAYAMQQDDVCDTHVGVAKPSIDAPVQARIYDKCKDVNFMIHGHATVINKDMKIMTTRHYHLCGDVREVNDVVEIINKPHWLSNGVINLRNHGFLIYAQTLEDLERIVNNLIDHGSFIIGGN